MIIFDIRFGNRSILAQRETVPHSFKVSREGPGEVTLNVPFASFIFTNERKAEEA